MSSGVALRSRGTRRAGATRPSELMGPMQSLAQTSRPGEKKVSRAQMEAIQHLYRTNPAITAARTILHGQLLSGGLTLKRNGENVDLKPAFRNHLQEIWLPFAGDVIDHFLMYGFCVVVFDEDTDSSQRQRAKRIKSARGNDKTSEPVNFIPIVPTIDTYDLAYIHTGKLGYKREYIVHATAPGQTARIDDEARVIVRNPCDAAGNINSPVAVCFDQGSFVSALTELALQAETTNSRPRLWTQMRPPKTNGAIDPQALFFDSASRDVAAAQGADDNQAQLSALAMQQSMCQIINKLQTGPRAETNGMDIHSNSFSGGGAGPSGSKGHIPPEIQPSLFVLPKVRNARNRTLPTILQAQAYADCVRACCRTMRWRLRVASFRKVVEILTH